MNNQKDYSLIKGVLIAWISLILIACGGEESETETSSREAADESPDTEEVVPVVITDQPDSITVTEGDRIELSVAATGGSLSYQWRKGGENISGATSSNLVLSVAEMDDAGTYDVVITNEFESEVSLVALVAVDEFIPPLVTLDIAWDVPTTRVDGGDLDLSEIDGYVIAYGEDSGDLNETVEVGGASSTSYSLVDMVPTTYYFRIATVDINGLQSEFSEVVSIDLL